MHNLDEWIADWRAGLARSESLRQSDVSELESHLREEMEHLKTAGLRDDEAFLIARRRLGDPTAIEEEFAKVHSHRRLLGTLAWMVAGVLAYSWVSSASAFLRDASVLLGFSLGLPSKYLSLFACVIHMASFAGIGMLLWRLFASRAGSRTPAQRTRSGILFGVLAACCIVAIFYLSIQSNVLLARSMSPENFNQIALPRGRESIIWSMLMPPSLAAALTTLLVLQNRRDAASA